MSVQEHIWPNFNNNSWSTFTKTTFLVVIIMVKIVIRVEILDGIQTVMMNNIVYCINPLQQVTLCVYNRAITP